MEAFRKVLKSKTLKEMFENIPYGFIDTVVIVILSLFILYPFTNFLYLQNIVFMPFISQHKVIIFSNPIAIFLIATYLYKKKLDGVNFDIKGFFKKHPYIPLFLVFGVLIFISVAVNGFKSESLFGTNERLEGLFVFLGYISIFILTFMLNNKKFVRVFLLSFVFVLSGLSIIYILNFALPQTFLTYNARNISYGHPNHLSYVLAMVAPLSVYMAIMSSRRIEKVMLYIAHILLCVSMLINDSLGGFLALICADIFFVLVFSLCKGKFRLISLLPIGIFIVTTIICCLLSSQINENISRNIRQLFDDSAVVSKNEDIEESDNHSSGVLRLILWDSTIDFIAEKPIFGYGGDTMEAELFEAAQGACDRTHNEFLQYAFFFGIPAALVYIVAVFMVYLKGFFRRKHLSDTNIASICAVAGYLVSAMFGNTVYKTAPFFFILLALSVYKNNKTSD